jgi:hypothetical protein
LAGCHFEKDREGEIVGRLKQPQQQRNSSEENFE